MNIPLDCCWACIITIQHNKWCAKCSFNINDNLHIIKNIFFKLEHTALQLYKRAIILSIALQGRGQCDTSGVIGILSTICCHLRHHRPIIIRPRRHNRWLMLIITACRKVLTYGRVIIAVFSGIKRFLPLQRARDRHGLKIRSFFDPSF